MLTQNTTPIDHQRLWTVEDVARFLQVSQSWVYKASSRGDLPCVRIGPMLRFNPATIRDLFSPQPPSATASDGVRR